MSRGKKRSWYLERKCICECVKYLFRLELMLLIIWRTNFFSHFSSVNYQMLTCAIALHYCTVQYSWQHLTEIFLPSVFWAREGIVFKYQNGWIHSLKQYKCWPHAARHKSVSQLHITNQHKLKIRQLRAGARLFLDRGKGNGPASSFM